MNPRHLRQPPGAAVALHQLLAFLSSGLAAVDRGARPQWLQLQAAHRFLHHPTASALRPGPWARNGAAARPDCSVRLCPLEQPKVLPPSLSVEPKTGPVLSLQAAELACYQLCRRRLTATTGWPSLGRLRRAQPRRPQRMQPWWLEADRSAEANRMEGRARSDVREG